MYNKHYKFFFLFLTPNLISKLTHNVSIAGNNYQHVDEYRKQIRLFYMFCDFKRKNCLKN